MELFKTSNTEIIVEPCLVVKLPSVLILKSMKNSLRNLHVPLLV